MTYEDLLHGDTAAIINVTGEGMWQARPRISDGWHEFVKLFYVHPRADNRCGGEADQVERNAVALNKDVVVMPGRDVRFVLRRMF